MSEEHGAVEAGRKEDGDAVFVMVAAIGSRLGLAISDSRFD